MQKQGHLGLKLPVLFLNAALPAAVKARIFLGMNILFYELLYCEPIPALKGVQTRRKVSLQVKISLVY